MLTGILLLIIGFLVIALATCVACVWALSGQIEDYRARLDRQAPQFALQREREDVSA